ncbi:unnamed protein product [marine sediment metagenome]|uniref:Uncharacterized protein n=1 Tax=marine sediment metagenome TaxID=412755 RepID=X1TC57_9ZZZZ
MTFTLLNDGGFVYIDIDGLPVFRQSVDGKWVDCFGQLDGAALAMERFMVVMAHV